MAKQRFFPSKTDRKNPLGNDRKIGVPPPQVPPAPDDETPIEYRFRLQRQARKCYGNFDSRLESCCITPLPGAWGVDLVRNPTTSSSHFVGLQQCSRVWTCPVCAQRISNQRRKELSFALAAAKLKGWTPVLVTYTLRHSADDLFEHVLAAVQASVRDFKSGRAYQDIKHEYGILGGIKSLETTFGEYGWHPHIHELMFLDLGGIKLNPSALKAWMADRWIAILEKHGFSASFAHGLDVRTADSDIADYIAKWGREPKEKTSGVEHEIAHAPNKKGHRDGLTPFQLLECVGAGDRRAWSLFIEYARSMQGKRQLVWSAGLRRLLEMPDELPDEQLPLIDEDEAKYTILEISVDEWRRCCTYELQPLLLQLAAAGATEALRAVLAQRDIRATIHEPPEKSIAEDEIKRLQPNLVLNSSPTFQQQTMPGLATEIRR